MKPVVAYSLVRLGLFAVLVAILVPLLAPWLPAWGATIIAAIIAFCVSYLAFGKLRRRVSDELAASRVSKETSTLRVPVAASDEAIEDDAVDGTAPRSTPPATPRSNAERSEGDSGGEPQSK